MKRRITLSIALVLSVVVLALISSDSGAKAQPKQRFCASSGVVTPGFGQKLRVTAVTGNGAGDVGMIRFAWIKYMAASCNSDGVCLHAVATQGATARVQLNGVEAVSFEVEGTGNGVIVVVESNSQDVRVNAAIIDPTGNVVTSFLTPSGGCTTFK